MPIYEYVCSACQHEFELIQNMGEAAIKKCPHCGKNRAQKKVSRSGFQLKGSGWYADGYSKESPKAKSNAADSSTAAKPSSAESKSSTTSEKK